MIHNKGRNRKSRSVGALACAALLLAVLGSASCGGGGGSGNDSPVGVSAVSPSSGAFVGGTPLTITGTNFVTPTASPNVVRIGGNACTDVVTVDNTTIQCKSPAGTPGLSVDVVVENDLGKGTLHHGFTYLTPEPPRSDLNGDGIADLVVGAPLDDTAGANAGAVYVFFGSASPGGLVDTSTDAADIRILGQHPGDNFGVSICTGDVDGDEFDDLVVGANLVDMPTAADAGCACVFRGPFAASTLLSASDADIELDGETAVPGDRFGSAVELADMDGDGRCEVLATAPRNDTVLPATLDTGRVYVFAGGSSLASCGATSAGHAFGGSTLNEKLGDAVTVGDLNDDGHADVVLTAQGGDPNLPAVLQTLGAVYVKFGGPAFASGPANGADAIFTGEDHDDQFGASATVGDINGDGADDLIVGAPLNDHYDVDVGRVYAFFGGAGFTGRSAELADIKISGLTTHNSFGRSLVSGDVNGDAIDDLIIGAPKADYLNDGNGRAYLFLGALTIADDFATGANVTFNGESYLDEALGTAVSVADLNGDGLADILCSAPNHDGGAGRAYTFFGAPAAGQVFAAAADLILSGSAVGSSFGSSIAEGQ